MGPAGEARIIQVHPTRRCNLSCLHCYSSSGPRQAESLPAELLTAALADAVGEGYTVLAVSGGEPLLYPGLHDVLAAARDLGMRTGLVTNGMLLNRARLTAIVDLVDAIALSLDGVPSSHNRMRDNPRAFDGMAANLAHLRASGLPFAFVFTLTEHNVDELGWVARFAYDQGATSLQVHPLTSAGHARQSLPGCVPDATELGFARYEVQRVQAEYDGRLSVQIDIASTAALADHPTRVLAGPRTLPPPHHRLADVISPLVIEPDGWVSPLCYGFNRIYGLGCLGDASLSGLARGWLGGIAASFFELCQAVHSDLIRAGAPAFVDWYSAVSAAASSCPA